MRGAAWERAIAYGSSLWEKHMTSRIAVYKQDGTPVLESKCNFRVMRTPTRQTMAGAQHFQYSIQFQLPLSTSLRGVSEADQIIITESENEDEIGRIGYVDLAMNQQDNIEKTIIATFEGNEWEG